MFIHTKINWIPVTDGDNNDKDDDDNAEKTRSMLLSNTKHNLFLCTNKKKQHCMCKLSVFPKLKTFIFTQFLTHTSQKVNLCTYNCSIFLLFLSTHPQWSGKPDIFSFCNCSKLNSWYYKSIGIGESSGQKAGLI